jgi:hypothetical protein
MSEVVEVPLTQGMVAIIDAADADDVLAYRWTAQLDGLVWYAKRSVKRPDGVWTCEYLHKFLAGYRITDHRNGDGLDNRRSNLREATTSQNGGNKRISTANKSGYKGVSWDKRKKKWNAQVKRDGRIRWLGYHATPLAAALAYDAGAREYFGEFSRLNFPEGR